MRQLRRWCVWFFLILFIMAGAAGTIHAYLADGEQRKNELVIGGNQIRIQETFEEPDQLIPGGSYTKTVQVENCGRSDCYVRIKAVFTDSRIGQYCTPDWNTTDFVYREDGYYYYKDVLSCGEMTSCLFTTVTVSPDLPTADLGDCSILVYAESCQAEGFGDYERAWSYWGRNRS